MRAKYEVPKHIKHKITIELYQYWENKRQLKELGLDIIDSTPLHDETGIKSKYQISKPTESKALKLADISTRLIVEASKRIRYIDNAMRRLNDSDREVVEYIFRDGMSQVQAEVQKNITSDVYYNTKRKIIYYTALEFGDIF